MIPINDPMPFRRSGEDAKRTAEHARHANGEPDWICPYCESYKDWYDTRAKELVKHLADCSHKWAEDLIIEIAEKMNADKVD